MTTSPELERGARAIAWCSVSGMTKRAHDLWVETHWPEFIPHARACYLAALPVGDDVLDKMARTDVQLFHTAYKPSTGKLGNMRDVFASAIRHIAGRSE